MLVSVIIATYRRSDTLRSAIESIGNQTYNNIEIIVVDDNADIEWNKKVENIIENVECKFNIKYIKNILNKGSARTRNIGIYNANGQYITFLDDDDIYLPDKIKNQIQYMTENNIDFSVTDLELLNEDGKRIEIRKRNYIRSTNKEELFKMHLMHHITGTDTMMFKKNYLLDIGAFEPIDVGDEFYLMQKAIESGGKFGYLPKCEVKAYVHSEIEGLSSGDSKIEGENELYKYKKKYFNKLDNEAIKYISMRHYAVLAYAEYRRRDYIKFLIYIIKSLIKSPLKCINLLINR